MDKFSHWSPGPRSLVLLLPGLMEPVHHPVLNSAKKLTSVLARSAQSAQPIFCAEQAVLALHGFKLPRHAELPSALCQYVADFNESPSRVVCADPIWLDTESDHARLFAVDSMEFSDSDSAEMLASLNAHFAQDDLQFHEGVRRRWYLTGLDGANLKTLPTAAIAGRNVTPFLPHDEESRRWRQLITEIQMLLHVHPVNERRLAQGLAPINSVWFWGGHPMPERQSTTNFTRLFADDAFGRGLSRLLPDRLFPVSESIAALHGSHLDAVCYRVFERAVVSGDDSLAIEAVAFVEKLLTRATHLLRSGKLSKIEIVPCNGVIYTMRRVDLLRFWAKFTAADIPSTTLYGLSPADLPSLKHTAHG